MPTASPTASPTVFPLNLDIYQLITTGLGGRPFQTLTVYDADWEDRESQIAHYLTMMSWRYNDADLSFGGFLPRDESSPVFPNGIRPHPPLIDGFGTYKITVGQGRGYLGIDSILNPVPDEYLICQNNFQQYVAGAGVESIDDWIEDCATSTDCTCNAENDELQVYGPAFDFKDFAQQFDFCATGLRGGRGYLSWYSPTFNDGSFPHCPVQCDSTSDTYVGTLNEPDFPSGAPSTGAVMDVCIGYNGNYLVTCTNKRNDMSDGENGRQWQTADVRLGSEAPNPLCCEPSCVGSGDIGGVAGSGSCTEQDIVPTVVCNEDGCDGDRTDLADCSYIGEVE